MVSIRIPKNIEFVYHGSYIEYVKDNDPNKPLTPKEKKACDEVVKHISLIAKSKRKNGRLE